VLAVLRQALDDDLDRVAGCLQLNGFVAADDGFEAHSAVINGASQLMVDVFGAAGAHARAAIGVATLPFGVPVEVSAVFAVEAR
uniref:RidA family protein n=1 Tax=uncultured Caulobacter sp. TaxID=158749 RepID=UPI0025FFBA58